jgi:hypothetical protein
MDDQLSTGDAFKILRAESQARRASNRERSTQRLLDAGIGFEMRNKGAHLIVLSRVDFWPGTGLWRDRTTTSHGRGLRTLLRHLESCLK